MVTPKKYKFLVSQKVEINGPYPLFDEQIINEAKKGDFWVVKDLVVSPARMWAVLNPGHAHQKPWIIPASIRPTRKESINSLLTEYGVRRMEGDWDRMKLRGFRCARVVVEAE
jgi:hypothetical protein